MAELNFMVGEDGRVLFDVEGEIVDDPAALEAIFKRFAEADEEEA